MIEKFLNWSTKIFKKPYFIIGIAVILTIVFAAGIPFLHFDNNIKTMLPAHNPDLKIHDYYEDENRFGNSALIYIGLDTGKNDGAYDIKTLEYIKKVKDKVEDLNFSIPKQNIANLFKISLDDAQKLIDGMNQLGVTEFNFEKEILPLLKDSKQLKEKFGWDQAFSEKIANATTKLANPKDIYFFYETPINKTQSLVNADFLAYQDDALVVKKLIENEELTPENVAGLKQRVNSWEVYDGALISKDGKLTPIIVQLNTHNLTVKSAINDSITKILKENKVAGITPYIDGESVIEDDISKYMSQDMMKLIPLVVIVVLLILFLCFRNLEGVLYPAIVILIAVVWPVGMMSFFKIPVTVIGTAMPVLLVAISSAYGIHQMNHYFLDKDTNKLNIMNSNMRNVGLAILLSGITVMVGFGALIVEDFTPIKNFGIFTAIGDFFAILAALYLLPSMILTSKKPKTHFSRDESRDWVGKMLNFFVKINKKYAKRVFIISAIISIVFAFGLPFIKAELNNVSIFTKNAPIRIADDKLNSTLAGTQTLNIILDSDLTQVDKRADGLVKNQESLMEITKPEVLNKIEQFSLDVQKQFPGIVTKVGSFNTVLKKMNQEMNEGKPEFYSIPQSADLINQYLLIFTGDVKSVLSPDHDKLKISIIMNREKASTDVAEQVRQYAVNYFAKDNFLAKNHLQVSSTGAARLYFVANQLLINGTWMSVIVCIIIVFLLLFFVLGNIPISVIAMVPIFITLIINFGILGITNFLSQYFPFIDAIPLNAGTAMVSSVAIGIGVDYSIHYITWYRNEMRLNNGDILLSLEKTILHKGRAILYNMLVIVGGFLVLITSKFVPLIQFGSLVALCMVTTAVGSLAVVPAIMKGLAKRKYKFLYLGIDKEKKQS
jgi:uncharacterized protein